MEWTVVINIGLYCPIIHLEGTRDGMGRDGTKSGHQDRYIKHLPIIQIDCRNQLERIQSTTLFYVDTHIHILHDLSVCLSICLSIDVEKNRSRQTLLFKI